MARILITGMSATGKSTLLHELAARGHRTVDTDDDGLSREVVEPAGDIVDHVWDEFRVEALLRERADRHLFLAGCVSNQGRFYPLLDAVVLLSVPRDVLHARLTARLAGAHGSNAVERTAILADLREVEPLLRAGCDLELDGTRPVSGLADELERLAAASAVGGPDQRQGHAHQRGVGDGRSGTRRTGAVP